MLGSGFTDKVLFTAPAPCWRRRSDSSLSNVNQEFIENQSYTDIKSPWDLSHTQCLWVVNGEIILCNAESVHLFILLFMDGALMLYEGIRGG